MNNIIERIWNQGGMVGIEDLQGLTFQDEALAHTFKISGVDTDGNAIALSGTPSGVMLRADNTDVALTCAVSDGCVTAELPAECYDVPGRAGITIFLTSDSKKTAIYAAVVSVARTQSGTAAPGTTASVVDLVNAIETAISQIPASDTNLKGALAATYSNSALYGVGSYAWYDGKLYKCTTAITTAETWNSAHWTEAKLANDVCDLKSAIPSDMMKSIVGTIIPRGYDPSTNQYTVNAKWGCTNEFTLDRYQLVEVVKTGYQIGWFKLVSGESTTTSGWKTVLTFEPGVRYIFLMRNTSSTNIDIADAINSIRITNGGEILSAESGSTLSSIMKDGLYNVRGTAMSVYSDAPTGTSGKDCLLKVEDLSASSSGTEYIYKRQVLSVNENSNSWTRFLRSNGTVAVDWTQTVDNARISALESESTQESALVYPSYDANIVIDTTNQTISLSGSMYIQLWLQAIGTHTPTAYSFLRNTTNALFIYYDVTTETVLFGNGNDIANYRIANPDNVCIYFGVYDAIRNNLSYSKVPITINGVRIPFYQKDRKFYGKTFSIMGDSVSTFENELPDNYVPWYTSENADQTGVYAYTDTYWGMLMQREGMELIVNDSYSGSRLTYAQGDTKPYMAGDARISALGNTAPDYMIILAGGNDVNQLATLGTFTPTLVDLTQITDESANNFADAYKILITKIKTKFPNTRLVILWYHNMSHAPNVAHGGTNYGKQAEYADIAKQVADFYGAQFIDLRKCGIDMFNNTTLDINNHPKKAGFELYYNYIIQKMAV